MRNAVAVCFDWFCKAVPTPTTKNFSAQLGCHFEEVHEHLQEIKPLTPEAIELLSSAKDAIHSLAEYLKANDQVVKIPAGHELAYLDALCDQMVTAIGCAHMAGMNIVGGFDEVNRSNWSKFEGGEPIFNENKKIMKGSNYTPADLTPFV